MRKKRLPKKWFRSAPPVGQCKSAPSRHEIRASALLSGAVAELTAAAKRLEDRVSNWALRQTFEKDQQIGRLQEQIAVYSERLKDAGLRRQVTGY